MSSSKKKEQAPAAEEQQVPAPAPRAEPEEGSPEGDLVSSGGVGAAVGGLIGGAGGAAIGGMLGLTGGALRDGKKKRSSWY
jgi:predicted lipid-binding transport protein (Tim44 family)